MVRKATQILTVVLLALGLLVASGAEQAEAKGKKKKCSFFKKFARTIKRKVKATCKKSKRAIVRTGAKIQNKIMDAGVAARARITGKRPKKVWRCGHYKKGQRTLTNGHWVRNTKKKKKPAGGMGPAPAPAPAPTSFAPPAPSAPPSMGEPLPPLDSALPQLKSKKAKAKRAKTSKGSKKSRGKKRG